MKFPKEINVLPHQSILREDCSFYIRNHKIDKPFALHRHEFFEIDIVISGRAQSNINGHVYDIERGSILFLTPADFHDITPLTAELETYNIAFPANMIYKQIWTFVPMSCRFATLSPESFQSVCLICQRLLQAYKNPAASTELLMKTGIEWCLFLLSDAANALSDCVQQVPKDISAVLAYIYDNFTGRVSRDEAAAIMHVSPIYFSNLFHKHMGLSFQEYLLNLRLDFARRLLIGKGTTVSDAAYSSGFNSVTYFSRVFTRRFGCPPGKYAEQNSL